MKLNRKSVFLILFLFLISNLITYKLTYDYVDMESFILYTGLDAYKLKAYDQNDTKYLDIVMNGGIDSVLNNIGKTGDIEKYKSLCRMFDKELFEIVDKYHRINRDRYGDSHYPELEANIAKGIIDMKKFCNVQD